MQDKWILLIIAKFLEKPEDILKLRFLNKELIDCREFMEQLVMCFGTLSEKLSYYSIELYWDQPKIKIGILEVEMINPILQMVMKHCRLKVSFSFKCSYLRHRVIKLDLSKRCDKLYPVAPEYCQCHSCFELRFFSTNPDGPASYSLVNYYDDLGFGGNLRAGDYDDYDDYYDSDDYDDWREEIKEEDKYGYEEDEDEDYHDDKDYHDNDEDSKDEEEEKDENFGVKPIDWFGSLPYVYIKKK